MIYAILVCRECFSKGRLVLIKGWLQIDRYVQQGDIHYLTKVISAQIPMLDRAPKETSAAPLFAPASSDKKQLA